MVCLKPKTRHEILFCESFSSLTCTCQLSGSSLLITCALLSSVLEDEGVTIHEMRSILIKASSCQCVTFFNLNSRHFVAFLHLCSKFFKISYAAGPSILQCKSCHACLGPRVRVCAVNQRSVNN